jgi:hypothetical protein
VHRKRKSIVNERWRCFFYLRIKRIAKEKPVLSNGLRACQAGWRHLRLGRSRHEENINETEVDGQKKRLGWRATQVERGLP